MVRVTVCGIENKGHPLANANDSPGIPPHWQQRDGFWDTFFTCLRSQWLLQADLYLSILLTHPPKTVGNLLPVASFPSLWPSYLLLPLGTTGRKIVVWHCSCYQGSSPLLMSHLWCGLITAQTSQSWHKPHILWCLPICLLPVTSLATSTGQSIPSPRISAGVFTHTSPPTLPPH